MGRGLAAPPLFSTMLEANNGQRHIHSDSTMDNASGLLGIEYWHMVSVFTWGSDPEFSMDDSPRTSGIGPEKDTETMQEIWLFSSRQTVALESIAVSLRAVVSIVETAALFYIIFFVGTAVVQKLFARLDA